MHGGEYGIQGLASSPDLPAGTVRSLSYSLGQIAVDTHHDSQRHVSIVDLASGAVNKSV